MDIGITLQMAEKPLYGEFLASFLGAFFAFAFFVLGQLWLSRREDRKELATNLKRTKEYAVTLMYFFKINLMSVKTQFEQYKEPVSIHLGEFALFPELENFYFKINKHEEMASEFIMLLVRVRMLNNNIQMINRWLKEMSDLSREAILGNRVEDFRNTMTENHEKLNEQLGKLNEMLEKGLEETHSLVDKVTIALRKYK